MPFLFKVSYNFEKGIFGKPNIDFEESQTLI